MYGIWVFHDCIKENLTIGLTMGKSMPYGPERRLLMSHKKPLLQRHRKPPATTCHQPLLEYSSHPKLRTTFSTVSLGRRSVSLPHITYCISPIIYATPRYHGPVQGDRIPCIIYSNMDPPHHPAPARGKVQESAPYL